MPICQKNFHKYFTPLDEGLTQDFLRTPPWTMSWFSCWWLMKYFFKNHKNNNIGLLCTFNKVTISLQQVHQKDRQFKVDYCQTPVQSDSTAQVSQTRSWLCFPPSEEQNLPSPKSTRRNCTTDLKFGHLDLTHKIKFRSMVTIPRMFTKSCLASYALRPIFFSTPL